MPPAAAGATTADWGRSRQRGEQAPVRFLLSRVLDAAVPDLAEDWRPMPKAACRQKKAAPGAALQCAVSKRFIG
jgi:hypothetical protein